MRWVAAFVFVLFSWPALAFQITQGEVIEIDGPTDNPFPAFTLSASLMTVPNPIPPGEFPAPTNQYGYDASVLISTGQRIYICSQSSPGPCGATSSSIILNDFSGVPFTFTIFASGNTFFDNGITGNQYNASIPLSDFDIELGLPTGFYVAVPEISTWAMLITGFLIVGFRVRAGYSAPRTRYKAQSNAALAR